MYRLLVTFPTAKELVYSLSLSYTLQGFTVAMDYYYYNKFILASLNIVLYNVFGKGGPDLYGTESWSFYFLNGALNFNILFAITLVALPMALGKVTKIPLMLWPLVLGDSPSYSS